jgi:hypothetical protein
MTSKVSDQHYLFTHGFNPEFVELFLEVQQMLNEIVGGYDNYAYVAYDIDMSIPWPHAPLSGANNTALVATLARLGFFAEENGAAPPASIQNVHDRRSCLGGFGHGDILGEWSLCTQPDPVNDDPGGGRAFSTDHAWFLSRADGLVHEYFHHYQRVQVMPRIYEGKTEYDDCCGSEDPVWAPKWWVEGAAQVFPESARTLPFEHPSLCFSRDFPYTERGERRPNDSDSPAAAARSSPPCSSTRSSTSCRT